MDSVLFILAKYVMSNNVIYPQSVIVERDQTILFHFVPKPTEGIGT